jgi:hypothetical protein
VSEVRFAGISGQMNYKNASIAEEKNRQNQRTYSLELFWEYVKRV